MPLQENFLMKFCLHVKIKMTTVLQGGVAFHSIMNGGDAYEELYFPRLNALRNVHSGIAYIYISICSIAQT